MLENIKLALDITDNTYDNKIKYYINKITNRVLIYCNYKEDNEIEPQLLELIEDKVIAIMSDLLAVESTDTSQDAINQELLKYQGAIKSISRGDTSITYNYDSISSSSSTGSTDNTLNFTTNETNLLNKFRKLKW